MPSNIRSEVVRGLLALISCIEANYALVEKYVVLDVNKYSIAVAVVKDGLRERSCMQIRT